MKKSKYSESQIVNILKEAENGVPLEDLMRTSNIGWAFRMRKSAKR